MFPKIFVGVSLHGSFLTSEMLKSFVGMVFCFCLGFEKFHRTFSRNIWKKKNYCRLGNILNYKGRTVTSVLGTSFHVPMVLLADCASIVLKINKLIINSLIKFLLFQVGAINLQFAT